MRGKVIQTENDCDRVVLNGGIGIVERADRVEQQVAIRFDDRNPMCDFDERGEVFLASIVTIHKSREAEFSQS